MEKRELAFAASRAWFACAADGGVGVLGCGNSSPATKEDGGTGGATAAKGGAAGTTAGTGGAAADRGAPDHRSGAAGTTVCNRRSSRYERPLPGAQPEDEEGRAGGTTTAAGGAAGKKLVVQPEARTPLAEQAESAAGMRLLIPGRRTGEWWRTCY